MLSVYFIDGMMVISDFRKKSFLNAGAENGMVFCHRHLEYTTVAGNRTLDPHQLRQCWHLVLRSPLNKKKTVRLNKDKVFHN